MPKLINPFSYIFLTAFIFLLNSSIFSQNNASLTSFIDRYMDSMLTEARQPGIIVSITQNGNIIYGKAKGYSDINTKEVMDIKMRFRIGSLTKTFTTTVLLQIVDEGLLGLDDTIDKFFPALPNANHITVRMLGDMSSGLNNYSEDKGFDDSMKISPKKKWKPEELVDISLRNGIYFEPGKDWHYSNTNTVLLGIIIQKLTGNTLEAEIKKRIIDKLGLYETEFATEPEISGYHSHGYNEDDTKFIEPLTDMTEHYDPSWGWAAGAMISSIKDLKIYLKALAEGSLISSRSQDERMKWSFNSPMMKYGFGLFKAGEDFLGHNGSYPGFHNISVHSVKTGMTIIVFYNSQTNRDPDDLVKRLIPMLEK